ncbi:MAG TPA: carboxypeptidase-like regulatory domain-containing protein [Puia sp.]
MIFLSFFILQHAAAQEKKTSEAHITITIKDRPFQEVLSIIEPQIPFKFAYSTELALQQKNVSITASDLSLSDFLTILLRGTSLTYNIIGDQIVLQNIVLPSRITLSGYIKDSRTGELLIGASIYIPAAGTGIFSNNYGFYSITVPPADTLELEISYVGYKSLFQQVNAHSNLTVSFGLEHNHKQEEINKLIIANDKREDNVKRNQSALIELSTDMIVGGPSLNGTGDILRSIQMLPGVQAGIDGTPGYCVRGGNTGQNLVLLDEATLYNPSHVFGLVSIFNAPAIKHASLMKGGFPATYGDHVSSVLDIAMKDGSNQQFGGIIRMGSISSGVTLYGPLQPGKSSFLISARRSTVDVLLRPILNQNYFSNYYFYDVNAKLNFQLSRRDRLLLSFYNGRDNNNYSTDSTDAGGINYSMHFGNSAYTIRWNHQYSGKLFSNTSLVYNRYHQFLSAAQDGYFAQLYSGIRDMNAKMDFSYFPSPAHKISAGADYLYQTLYPATLSQKISSTDSSAGINPDVIPEKSATRLAVYASDAMKFGRRFQAYIGVRIPFYYRPDAQYLNFEPRLSLLYMVDPATSVKVSYTHMHQYIHLVQSYNSSFPAEIWLGSSNIVLPQASREVSAGIFKNFKENIFQTSLEFYYKAMDNQLLFKGGTTPTIDNNLEDQLITGKGWSYGSEFLIRKNRGKWTGWLAYSLAWAYQQFDSLNLGKSFPFAYDRRHTLDISTAYMLNTHWRVSANFFIASGRAFTLNTSSANPNTNSNPLYSDENSGNTGGNPPVIEANNYRLAPYDRLDLSIRYKKSRNTGRRILETEWIFSVYNVYARHNTSFAYRTIDPSTGQVIAREVSFIPVIPSITYSLRF